MSGEPGNPGRLAGGATGCRVRELSGQLSAAPVISEEQSALGGLRIPEAPEAQEEERASNAAEAPAERGPALRPSSRQVQATAEAA